MNKVSALIVAAGFLSLGSVSNDKGTQGKIDFSKKYSIVDLFRPYLGSGRLNENEIYEGSFMKGPNNTEGFLLSYVNHETRDTIYYYDACADLNLDMYIYNGRSHGLENILPYDLEIVKEMNCDYHELMQRIVDKKLKDLE